ncbi:hypothetical protein PENTCL1PPCAC_8054, partial [Pristionchus entomophagus]
AMEFLDDNVLGERLAPKIRETTVIIETPQGGYSREEMQIFADSKPPIDLSSFLFFDSIEFHDLDPMIEYSREEMISLRNYTVPCHSPLIPGFATEQRLQEELDAMGEIFQNLHNTTYRDFHYGVYENVQQIADEGIYSTETMKHLENLTDYTWQRDWVVEKDSLAVMNHCFPDKRRRRRKVKSADYWIWHNVNGQQSFAVFFGFFPFYLPHFDAAAFISAARPDSLVPVYLTSQLYQEHLMLREKYESEPYRVEQEEEQRRKMIVEYQKMIRFPLTDEHSLVYYEDAERNALECTLEQAQSWLQAWFFTSEMKFVVAPRGEEVRGKEWTVFSLNDLIDRNGKSMPFLFSNSTHSERMNEVEEINQMRQELHELAERRSKLEEQLQQIQSRSSSVQQGIQRLAEKFPALATRSAQTHATMGPAVKVEISEPSHPQFVPKSGVDPFAVLRMISLQSNTRKITGDAEIIDRFELLRKRFDRCDKKALVLRTSSMINKYQPASCRLCELKMESASTFIEHLMCRKHVSKLSAVCADSLDFWFDAIKEVTKNSNEPAVSPLSILSFCQRSSNPHLNLQQAAATMQRKLRDCDKKALDGEPALRALFNTRVSCSVCIRLVFIDKPANLIAHFSTAGHIATATRNGGQMHADVIDYWMRALDRAMVATLD